MDKRIVKIEKKISLLEDEIKQLVKQNQSVFHGSIIQAFVYILTLRERNMLSFHFRYTDRSDEWSIWFEVKKEYAAKLGLSSHFLASYDDDIIKFMHEYKLAELYSIGVEYVLDKECFVTPNSTVEVFLGQ